MKQSNTLIGRRCVIDFACRWKGYSPSSLVEQLKAEYEKREDWNQPGEIVSFNATDHMVTVLRDDNGQLAEYYKGEVTVTGPAPDPNAKVIALLTEIRDLLKSQLATEDHRDPAGKQKHR